MDEAAKVPEQHRLERLLGSDLSPLDAVGADEAVRVSPANVQ